MAEWRRKRHAKANPAAQVGVALPGSTAFGTAPADGGSGGESLGRREGRHAPEGTSLRTPGPQRKAPLSVAVMVTTASPSDRG